MAENIKKRPSITSYDTEAIIESLSQIKEAETLSKTITSMIDEANDQQQLTFLRQCLKEKLIQEDDDIKNESLNAISACQKKIDKKFNEVPENNPQYFSELFGHGLFCLIGTIVLMLALVSFLNPFGFIIGPAFLLISLSIGFTIKSLIQNIRTPNYFKQTPEFTKLILTLAVTAEIIFYNLSDVTEIGIQTTNILGIVALSIGALTAVLGGYIIILAIIRAYEYKSYLKHQMYIDKLTDSAQSIIKFDKKGNLDLKNLKASCKKDNLFQNINEDQYETLIEQVKKLIKNNPNDRIEAQKELLKILTKKEVNFLEKKIQNFISFESLKNTSDETKQKLFKAFNSSMPLIELLKEKNYDTEQITVYLKGIIGNLDENDKNQKTSKELSELCLSKIRDLLINDKGVFKDKLAQEYYILLENETKIIQADQPVMKNIPLRIVAEGLLIVSSILIHILIAASVAWAFYLTGPLFIIGALGLMFFVYNESKEINKKHLFLGITSTSFSFIMMFILFASVAGLTVNPIGLAVIMLASLVLVASLMYYRKVNAPQEQILALNQIEITPIIDDTNDETLHPDFTEKHTMSSQTLVSTKSKRTREADDEGPQEKRQRLSKDEEDDDGRTEGKDEEDNDGRTEGEDPHPHK